MALLVPDESLASVAESDAYHEGRGNIASWEALEPTRKENLLRQAFDFLFAIYGARWPAGQAFGTLADGSIPAPMRNACCILALKAKAGPLLPDTTPQKVESTVGPITTKWAAAKTDPEDLYPEIKLLVRPYLPAASGNPYRATIGRA